MLDTPTHLLFLPSYMCVCVYLSLFGVCAVHMHKPPLRSLERVALLYWQASESLWSAFLCWLRVHAAFLHRLGSKYRSLSLRQARLAVEPSLWHWSLHPPGPLRSPDLVPARCKVEIILELLILHF